ncbi:MAG TPA: tripartite tricarboxylate transporter TctB family protein [Bauldia sp.]|nr:tripartite tricarboxylate transporter TctB family protein [Bauldia sp.]
MSLTGTPARGRGPDRAALAIGVFLLVVAGLVAFDAASIRAGVATYSRIGPAVFPYAIAGALGLLGLATLVTAFRKGLGPRVEIKAGPPLWIAGGLAGQIALLSFAGFSLATGVVFAATAAAFGRRRLWVTYPVGVGVALAVWLVFALALKLVLPAGPLEIWARGLVTGLFAPAGGGA